MRRFDGIDDRIPLGVLLVAKGTTGERLLFLHPFQRGSEVSELSDDKLPSKHNAPQLVSKSQHKHTESVLSYPTQFGLSSNILAHILCVDMPCDDDQPFEMKVDNIRFAANPKKITSQGDRANMFSIVFALPAYVDYHIIEAFQMLSKKLALAIDSLQTLNQYFEVQDKLMRGKFEEIETIPETDRPENPWESIAKVSKLAVTLAKVFDDVGRTGVVQVFIDDFIEVGFCVEPLAFDHALLAPKNRTEVDRLIHMIRPYHGILLLEDIWPSPDGNPSVTLLLKHCQPDRSIQDISISSGIPLLQVFLIVRHLLMWARAMVIYPLSETNVYTSATRVMPLGKHMERFGRQFSAESDLANTLAHFDPPNSMKTFLRPTTIGEVPEYKDKVLLAEQCRKSQIVVFLVRHQLLIQLHQFCYILPPFSGTELPSLEAHCPDALKIEIRNGDFPNDVQSIITGLCSEMLQRESYSKVERNLHLFSRMAPFMKGEHHIEDIMFRLNEDRATVNEVLDSFSLVISTFLRPDYIAE